jgi:uncharacterized protein
MTALVGLGLRRSLCRPLLAQFLLAQNSSEVARSAVDINTSQVARSAIDTQAHQSGNAQCMPDFFELAPENWLDVGGRFGHALHQLAEHRALFAHGLSLSLGGTDPLDLTHLNAIAGFLDRHAIKVYSEHLSASAINGHLYDLAPIPFTEEMLRYLTKRIQQTQDRLGRKIAVENSSYYLKLAGDAGLSELEFIQALLQEADCDLLLDVNNVLVNSRNHHYDPNQFIQNLDPTRVRYLHIAGHDDSGPIIVDTHGADVPDSVWQLLEFTYATIGARDTLIERDFNMPPLPVLLDEVARAKAMIAKLDHA